MKKCRKCGKDIPEDEPATGICKDPTDDEWECDDCNDYFHKDYSRGCQVCGCKPVVKGIGLCGPCTFGEAETADGNW